MGVGLGDSVPADFHEEKIGTFSGSPGAKLPAAFLLPFVAEDKRKWPRIGQFFCQNCVLYARTNHEAVFLYALMPRGTPFLDVKKGGKEASGGKAP